MTDDPTQDEQKNNSVSEPDSNPDDTQETSVQTDQTETEEFTWGDGLSIDISAGLMTVKLELDFKYAENYDTDDIVRYLEQQHNIHGVKRKAIQTIFDEKKFNEEIVVAKGTQPNHGEDGRVDWQIDLSILEGAKLVERGGRVDWKEQHYVLQVKEDQLLARMIDPTEGKPGVNIYGEEIPANPGKEVKFPAGKGIRISEDGKELYAELTGVVCKEGDKYSITDTYNVPGDVSFKSGNIDCEETVIISGGVLSDFKVHSGHDIHVNGLVEGAELEASANIYINAGIQGNDKAYIKVGGDITVKFINNATIEAQGNIIVDGAITNSKIRSLGKVTVTGNKAVIAGGHVAAEKEISAAVVGSEIGVKTVVEIGEQLLHLQEQRKEEEKKLKSLLSNYNKMRDAVNTLNMLRDKGKLPKEKESLRLKLVRGGMQIQGEIKKRKAELQSMDDQIKAGRKQQKGVIVKDLAWPGTIVQIMGHRLPVRAQNKKVIFALLGDEIEMYAYKEDETQKKKEKK